MILYRDAEDGPSGSPAIIEIVKEEGPKVWYRIIDLNDPHNEIFDCRREAIDPKFYEISKQELVKRVLNNG